MTRKKQPFILYNLPLIVAFLAPVIILLLIYITREIWPFGDQMYLRSDMYHQYAPFLKLFQTTIKEGSSLHYSWNIGLGTNFMSTYAYYVASPLNWIVGILPSDHIPEIMSGFIFLKSGLMSSFFAYYLRHHFQKNSLLIAGFGTLYALSGYMAAYSWNVMWLDCLVLLPLVVLGLERLVREKKVLLYTISFALCVLSNYYIAIMVCIFTALYFIYLMAAEADLQGVKDVFVRIGRYLLYSVLGGLMGAVIFLPAFLTLFGTASADSSFPTHLTAYFNLLELFAHGAMNTKVTMMNGYLPNIYAGIAVFALIPLFWLNGKILLKIRAGKTILMAILLFSFSFNIPAFIWHGFHFPNSLPSRQSFIYIFLILTMGYEALLKIREVSVKKILISFGIAICAVFALQVLYDSEDYPMSIAWVSAGFLALYLILVLLYHNRKYLVRFAAGLLILIAIFVEAGVNTDATGYGTTSRVSYTEDNDAITYVLNQIEDEDFYRVEKIRRRTKNDGAWSGYRSASIFSSVTTAALSDFYESFGMQHGTNSFSWYGNTPLSSALLGVRYQLGEQGAANDFREYVTGREDVCLYKSKYYLPLGFMVNETTQAEVNLMANDPFAVQNDFLDAAKGIGPVFDSEKKFEGTSVRYTAPKDGHLYFQVDRKVKNVTIRKVNGEEAGKSNSFSDVEGSMIVYAGKVRQGDEIEVLYNDEEVDTIGVIPAMLDEEALKTAIEELGSEPLENLSFGDTFVKGEVTAAKKGMLFTSIPYDKGWKVYVDGKVAELRSFYGAFIQIPLSEGKHTIELRYQVPGLTAGLLISIFALAVFVLLQILRSIRRKRAGSQPQDFTDSQGPIESQTPAKSQATAE